MAVVDFEILGHIANITINRPEYRNALNAEILVRLFDAFHEVEHNPAIRVAIITGAGDKAFSAGADLGSLLPLITATRKPADVWDERYLKELGLGGGSLLRHDPIKPVIAAVNGHAVAGGMELVQGTDIRIAVPRAKFGLREVRWAVFPGGGSTVRLPCQMPYAKAMELMLTGDLISAEDALALGFLNYVVPPDSLMSKAMELAEKIATNGPIAVQAIRKSVRKAWGRPEDEALKIEAEISESVFSSEDAIEGPRAFMEKRTPVYKGR
jgi:enoyl-CoA hydratase